MSGPFHYHVGFSVAGECFPSIRTAVDAEGDAIASLDIRLCQYGTTILNFNDNPLFAKAIKRLLKSAEVAVWRSFRDLVYFGALGRSGNT